MRKISRNWLAVAAALVAAPVLPLLPVSATGNAQPEAGQLQTHVCSTKPRIVCGTFLSPLDRAHPAVGHVRVFFERYVHTDQHAPALEPIVAVEGGPGFATTGSAFWYVGLFAPLMARHDLVLMDLPGTGRSQAIDCPPIQQGGSGYVAAVGSCGAQLGATANDWGTANAADDLAQLLQRLGIAKIDLYGDSYGTFFVQTFAVRHPDLLRTIVMDSAYPAYGIDPWGRDTNTSLDAAFRLTCARNAWCASGGENVMAVLAHLAVYLTRHPVHGVGYDADGHRQRVVGDLATLLTLATDAAANIDVYRELLGAGRALLAGDTAPIVRLLAEAASLDANGNYRAFSAGLYTAVACHDYPWMYDMTAPPSERVAEYRQALARLSQSDPEAFAPFSVSQWAGSGVESFDYCSRWPAQASLDPPVPRGARYPSVPTLVLAGDLDSLTSSTGARIVASRFPKSTFVEFVNSTHVNALGDLYGCASVIVRRFVVAESAGSTACAGRIPAVRMVEQFALRVADAIPAQVASTADHSTPRDRKVAAASAETVADALARWVNMGGSSGVGLRGGSFTTNGSSLIRFTLTADRWAADLPVSGAATWDQTTGGVLARVAVAGGRLTMSWSDGVNGATATITGNLGGRAIDLSMPAP